MQKTQTKQHMNVHMTVTSLVNNTTFDFCLIRTFSGVNTGWAGPPEE